MRKRSQKTAETIRGRIETVFYASARFSAGRIRQESGERVAFAGVFLARSDERVVLHGQWKTHPKYGRQFQVEFLEYDLALDSEGLESYLAQHPEIKGIGPKKAQVIARRFGKDFERFLLEKPEEISRAAKVPMRVIEQLGAEWKKTRTLNVAFTWLSAFGLTHFQVTTLVEKLGHNVIGLLKSDPYLLMKEIPGFGFRRVDQVALKMGLSKEHEGRLRAGLLHCVDEAIRNGDCWVEHDDLIGRANLLLALDVLDSRRRIEGTLRQLMKENLLDGASFCSRLLVARPKLFEMEKDLSAWLLRSSAPAPHRPKNLDRIVESAGPTLNRGQLAAVKTALSHSICVISGGAGSGKTYSVATIVRICEQQGLDVLLAAPTGKAAKRLEQMVDRPAFTIHRLLEYDGVSFGRGPGHKLDANIVVVDEVSMLDVPLAWHLLSAIDLARTSVVLVGDHNQLPPVGPGNILRDLIQTRPVPKVVLDTVVRQAGVLEENSTAVLQGEVRKTAASEADGPRPWILANQLSDPLQAKAFLLKTFDGVLQERLGYDPIADVQVLTPTHKGPLGTKELNCDLQRILQKRLWGIRIAPPMPNRRPSFHLHDKVIQTRNDYEIDVMNGSVGFVREVGRDGTLVVDFDGKLISIPAGSKKIRNIELAYALTFHRAQGSEFPCAIVIIHKSHSFMHHRNLFYTGVTRAQKTAIILGDSWGILNCAQKKLVNDRKTFLSFLLAEAPSPSETTCPFPIPDTHEKEWRA